MKIKRVRITKAALSSYWYADKIGQEFYLLPFPDCDRYEVIQIGTHIANHWPTRVYLTEGDFDVLETFDGEVVKRFTISIERTNGDPKPQEHEK